MKHSHAVLTAVAAVLGAACSVLIVFPAPAVPQETVSREVVSGGGGTQAGDAYSVSHTIGQTAAAVMSSPDNSHESGFWHEFFAIVAGSDGELVPRSYCLYQNYPNPFNPLTEIRFALPRRSRVNLSIFNVLGQHVRTVFEGKKDAGIHTVCFDGHHLASGVYFYRLEADRFVQTKKMILLR